ncbi:MAG: 6-phosphogluconolactonase [Acidobacteriota bacterium]
MDQVSARRFTVGNSCLDIVEDEGALAVRARREFLEAAESAVQRQGRCAVALAGGSTPKRLYGLLAEERRTSFWGRIHFFWGDERWVPPGHPDSNYRMAWEILLSKIPIPAANIHPVPTTLTSAAQTAESYEQTLRAFFAAKSGEPPVFDLIWLGMGADGHTASLFPGTQALSERSRWAVAVPLEKPGVDRISLTLPVINAGKHVVFLVSGPDKSETLRTVLEDPGKAQALPAHHVRPTNGTLLWLVDKPAASKLTLASQHEPSS